MVDELDGSARIVCLRNDGEEILFTAWKRLERRVVPLAEWSSGLTAMRARMSQVSDARIVLGGRVDRYMGSMPGIAEEALLSMRIRQPLFVVGGFGGCARDIAEALALVGDRGSESSNWANRKDFREYSGKNLHNGLTAEENEILARTPHIDQAVALILRGLTKVFTRPKLSEE
ncbi:SLOG cluster2 [compost metagenome]